MLKKFENLGTALSRNESKKVVGGVDGIYVLMQAPLGDEAGCSGSCDVTIDKKVHSGTCTSASGGLCYCSSGLGSC